MIDKFLRARLTSSTWPLLPGHVQSTCLRNRGLLGAQDWTLIKHVLAEDFTLVTVNAKDFRDSGGDAPGGLYATIEMHCRTTRSPSRLRSN